MPRLGGPGCLAAHRNHAASVSDLGIALLVVCQSCAMGIPGIAVQPAGKGNSESAVRFLAEWVCDGEAGARIYLADHSEPEGVSLVAMRGPDVIGLVAILWESAYAGFRCRGIPLVHQVAVAV